jgi:hypothetical protein
MPSDVIINFIICSLLALLILVAGQDSLMPVQPLLGFKPMVVYLPSSSATGICVVPHISAKLFPFSRVFSDVNVFFTCIILWMESCHGITKKTVSPLANSIQALVTVLITCRSSITDSIRPLGMGFRRILFDV